MSTVRDHTFELMRKLGMTTIFGNPGSTEETFLKQFPDDFTYVLGLQEASVLAMADGYAQASGTVGFVNLHTAPGLGNALGNLVNTRMSKTPMIITTGQQTRAMLLMEPWLSNVDAATFPRPHVKWSYETSHAEETPAAFMRAYAAALQSPQGPVYLSLPLDDWDKEAIGTPVIRSVAQRSGPDPERIAVFAQQLSEAKNPLLVFGSDIDRSGGWDAAIALAEKIGAPVYLAPASERCNFPEDHPQFAGSLIFGIAPLHDQLVGHDLVVVIGAPVFRYYPYVPGEYLPEGCRLLHITDDPNEAARAPVGDSLISNAKLALEALHALTTTSNRTPYVRKKRISASSAKHTEKMTPDELFAAIASVRPENAVIVTESPSNLASLRAHLPVTKPLSYFTLASGGLGFGLPASIGIALAERSTKRNRPVLSIIGDGSFQYSVQALWTAAQMHTPNVIVVPVNHEYAILKSFAALEQTPDVPGLSIPGIDIAGLATAYGCHAVTVTTPDAVCEHVQHALQRSGPTVIAAMIDETVPPLF